MKKNKFIYLAALVLFAACSKNDNDSSLPTPVVNEGDTATILNGGAGGSTAENTVFFDFSTATQDSVKRNSWTLAFYTGSNYRVMLNLSNGASAFKINKTDINTVTSSDFTATDLTVNLTAPSPAEFAKIDSTTDLIPTKSVIPEISSTDASNQVWIINPRGTSHSLPYVQDSLWKIRVLRSSTNGYTVQYARVNETTYKTLNITKDNNYNFVYASLDAGKVVTVQPQKAKWDIQYTWATYYTTFSGAIVPYSYSDLIFINNVAGLSANQRVYATKAVRDTAYKYFNKDSVSKLTFSSAYDAIGSKWRNTTGTIGVLNDRFYVVKDLDGNYYALQFINFIAQDGGTRGKPKISYKLLK